MMIERRTLPIEGGWNSQFPSCDVAVSSTNLDKLEAEIKRLRSELTAVTALLVQPSCLAWGWSKKEEGYGYFLDGRYCGKELSDATRKAAEAGENNGN